MSTLCAGCGHDSITAAIIRALWELSTAAAHDRQAERHRLLFEDARPISSSGAHGFNSAHGRMPPIATGANAANRELTYIGISGDGDSLSIGLGHLCHAIRRNVSMLYVIENNGVYGLTKGQFSASADVGSKSKRGEANRMAPIDPVMLGPQHRRHFRRPQFLRRQRTARAHPQSGHRASRLRAGRRHFALRHLSTITTGSTKSYLYTRQTSEYRPIARTSFRRPARSSPRSARAERTNVTMHDGSVLRFTAVPENYDPTDKEKVGNYLEEHHGKGEIVTGLLYVNENVPDVHEMNNTTEVPLARVPFVKLCPGSAALAALQEEFR